METKRKIMLAGLITVMMLLLIPMASFPSVDYTVLEPINNGLKFPEDVAISPDETIYIVDGSKNKVLIYNRKSQLIGSILIHKPTSVAVYNGYIYIGTNDDMSVKILDSAHNIIGSLGSGAGEFKLPRNITIDNVTGNVYVVDQLDNSIKVYTSGGIFISKINDYPNLPQDVTIVNNEVYVVDQPLITDSYGNTIRGAEVQVFNMTGTPIRHFGSYGAQEGQLVRPAGITSDTEGILYITDSFHTVVLCFDTGGSYLGAIQDSSNPMSTPMGITLGEDRKLFVASLYTSSIHIFGLEGYTNMDVSPPSLSFIAQQGQTNPPPRTLTITNSGTGTLTYTATSTEGWIVLTGPADAVGPGGSVTLPVEVNITGMGAATYNGKVTIIDNSGAQEVIQVSLEITAPPPPPVFTVTPSAGANGEINPSTPQMVNYNETTSFTVTPNTGYQIASVTGCGGTLSGNIYTTGPITDDCAVTATFEINKYTITASAGPNGNISPSGVVSVDYGANQSFNITPSTNYHVVDVQVDGSSVGEVTAYTFSNVIANHTIVATFEESDITPPTGAITINSDATYTNTTSVTINLSAYDPSGVSQMCISNTQTCSTWVSYTSTKSWTLLPGDGIKTVNVWYQDMLGNANTEPYSGSITLDMTAPVLNVSALSDGSWTNNELLNVAGEVTDDTGIEQLAINDEIVPINSDGSFSYPINLQDGPNAISVIATDLVGNQSTDTRTINLDRTAPIIMIVTPSDNIKTKQSTIDVTGIVDDQSMVTVKVNDANPVLAQVNGNDFSLLQIPLIYGMNTIEVTATDLASNTSTAKRTVTLDDLNPSLSVTDPSQDIKTNQADMIIKGETGDDLTAVTVTVTMDTNIYNPAVTSGQFEQPVTFTDEKTYQIYVTAVDEAGNETIVQRNVVYDITPPMVTLDPVTSPTNLKIQVLTGTMQEGATVSVTCSTATVGTVTYPASTEWSVTLTDMIEGNNQIIVMASDEAGNVSDSVTTTIVVVTKYTVTASAGSNGKISPSGTITVNYGSNQTFTITPDAGYIISDVVVDGVSMGAVTTYTFSNVTTNHTISASFGASTYYIAVTVPNGGEIWARGTTQTIKWTYAGNPGSFVKIELLKGGIVDRIITTKTSLGKNGAGSYRWEVSSKRATGSDYTIRITSTSDSNYTDTSDGDFTIKDSIRASFK